MVVMKKVTSCVGRITPTNFITSHLEERDPELRRVTSSNTLSNRSEFSPEEYRQWLGKGANFIRIDQSAEEKNNNADKEESNTAKPPLPEKKMSPTSSSSRTDEELVLQLSDCDTESEVTSEVPSEVISEVTASSGYIIPPSSLTDLDSVLLREMGARRGLIRSESLGDTRGALRRSGSFNRLKEAERKKVVISPMVKVLKFEVEKKTQKLRLA